MNQDEAERIALKAEASAVQLAFRVALKAVIDAHPHAALLHGRVALALEQGAAVLLSTAVPERAVDAYEAARAEIAAMVPARYPPS